MKIVELMSRNWVPQSISEYFFFDQNGCLVINEEQVKGIHAEFVSVMGMIYNQIAKKYDEICQNVITDQDLDCIEFPLVCKTFKIEPFYTLLQDDIAAKLNLDGQ